MAETVEHDGQYGLAPPRVRLRLERRDRREIAGVHRAPRDDGHGGGCDRRGHRCGSEPHAGVAFGGKAVLDRIVFGPNASRFMEAESRALANHEVHASAEPTNVAASNMPRRRAWPVVMLIVLGGSYFLYGELAPVFSPAARKARMEESVRRVIQEKFPGQPQNVALELNEESPERWNGVAKIGANTYRIKAKKETSNSLLTVEWQRAE